MKKIGDYLVYKRDVCLIKEIKKIKNIDYYVLMPYLDSSLKLSVPCNNEHIRNIVTKKEVNDIILSMPTISALSVEDKIIESKYRSLMSTGSFTDLITIIKTSYLRNKKRSDDNKKPSAKDIDYFNLAEKYLYTEFSLALNLNYEDTKDYVTRKVEASI